MVAEEQQPLLSIRDLSRVASGRRLVDRVSLDVAEGAVTAIVGESGSGKSTLLRMIVRLDEPTGGTVLLRGVDFREVPPRELRRRIGYVAQRPALFPGTVGENVAFGPRQRGIHMASSSIEELLAELGLQGFSGRDVGNLSGGEAQRVGLARTLANRPEVLLLDEPTSALDASAREGVERMVRRVISAHRLTCLIVTHDEDQARRLADGAAVISGGRLVRVGSTGEVLGASVR